MGMAAIEGFRLRQVPPNFMLKPTSGFFGPSIFSATPECCAALQWLRYGFLDGYRFGLSYRDLSNFSGHDDSVLSNLAEKKNAHILQL